MDVLLLFLHLLALVCWLGSIVFFSFFTAPVLFRTLERQEAGDLIGKIFPNYYRLGYICGGLALLTLVSQPSEVMGIKLALLLAMIVCTLFAGLAINPNARAIKERLRVAVLEDEKTSLEARFKKLHRLSVQLNATTLFAGLGLLWYTAMGLTL